MLGLTLFTLALVLIVSGIATVVDSEKTRKQIKKDYGGDMTRSERQRVNYRTTSGLGGAALGVVIALMLSMTIVPARTVGVVTAFGKPTGSLSNGLHFIKPWESVEKMDASLQTNVYTGDSAIMVRLANQSQAKADASIQWQLKEENAEQMFLDYREFDKIHTDLVDREFRATVNEVLSQYNPLDTEVIATGGIDLGKYSGQVKKEMQKRVGKSIDVRSVALPIINYDTDTQSKIDRLQTEIANTRAAEQSKKTAQEVAEANDILSRSLNDNILSQRCIEAAQAVGAAPVGCIPRSGSTPLIDMRAKD